LGQRRRYADSTAIHSRKSLLPYGRRNPLGSGLGLSQHADWWYKPGLSAVNGWWEHPEELDDSAIVECEVIARHEPDWYTAKLMASRDELKQRDPLAFASLAAHGFFNPNSPENEYLNYADQYRGWVRVVCHRVVPLIEIPQHFPQTQREFLPPTIDTPCQPVASANLEYWCHGDNGGGAFEWWVTTKTTPRRLLLYCLYISSDPFEIHNMILPE
jgi:hypothetical protein